MHWLSHKSLHLTAQKCWGLCLHVKAKSAPLDGGPRDCLLAYGGVSSPEVIEGRKSEVWTDLRSAGP